MRKLSSFRKILDIKPIEGADSIELAFVDGWRSVVQKGKFSVGETVVYIETDAWVPYKIAPFLSKGKNVRVYEGVEGERLTNIRLRGQLSQGLILSKKFFTDELKLIDDNVTSDDLDKALNIKLYEKPIPACLNGEAIGYMPSCIPKTGCERIQNIYHRVHYEYEGYYFEVTEKMDGTSCTVYFENGNIRVFGREIEYSLDCENSYADVVRNMKNKDKILKDFSNRRIAIQGELCGEGINKNRHCIKGQDFFVFDIYDVDTGKYFNYRDITIFCSRYRIKEVYFLEEFKPLCFEDFNDIESILALAQQKNEFGNQIEGLVFKTISNNKRLLFKVLNNDDDID